MRNHHGDDTAQVRAARAEDVPAVKAVTDAAYHPYIERIGVVPQPMEADHAADVAAGRVFVTGSPSWGWWWSRRSPAISSWTASPSTRGAHGTGVGRRLLHFVDARARDLGLGEIRPLHERDDVGEPEDLPEVRLRGRGAPGRRPLRPASTTASGWTEQAPASAVGPPGQGLCRLADLGASRRALVRLSRIRRLSVLFRGLCTVMRRIAASFSAYRVPRCHRGRRFRGEFLIGAGLSVAAVTSALSVACVTLWA